MIEETPAAAPGGDVRADPAADAGGWRPSQIAALVVVATAGLMVSLTMSVLIPVLPQVAGDLHSSTTSTEWLLTSTLLAAAVAVPIAGRLGDLYGKRLMLIVSAGFLTAGSLICAVSHSLVPLVIGRGVTGLSLGTVSLGISLINVTLPPRRASSAVALVSAMLGVGGALGVPLAGFVGERADYHLLFWICVAGGVVSLLGSWRFLAEPAQRAAGRLDVPGTVLLGAALICLLLPLSEAALWGWGAWRTDGLLAVAAVLLIVFVLVERRVAAPLVDLAANGKPALLLTNVASACVGFALFASFIGTAAYVETPAGSGYGFGTSIVVGGLCLLPSGLGMLALSPVSARMTRRFGPKITLCTGSLVVAAGFAIRIGLTARLWEIVAGTTVAGAGTGIAYAAMPALIALGSPPAELAAANGLNALSRVVGSSIASAIGGTILTSSVVVLGGVALPSLTAYRILFGTCAIAAVAGAFIALLVPYPPGYSPLDARPGGEAGLVSLAVSSRAASGGPGRARASGLVFAHDTEHDVLDDVVGGRRLDHGPDSPGQGHLADRLIEFHAGLGEPAIQDLVVVRGQVDRDPDPLVAGLALRSGLTGMRAVGHGAKFTARTANCPGCSPVMVRPLPGPGRGGSGTGRRRGRPGPGTGCG
jgi:MFS family permease